MNQKRKTYSFFNGFETILSVVSIIAAAFVMAVLLLGCHNPLLSGNEDTQTNPRCDKNIPHELTNICTVNCVNEIPENESEILENENENPIIDDDDNIDNGEIENGGEIEEENELPVIESENTHYYVMQIYTFYRDYGRLITNQDRYEVILSIREFVESFDREAAENADRHRLFTNQKLSTYEKSLFESTPVPPDELNNAYNIVRLGGAYVHNDFYTLTDVDNVRWSYFYNRNLYTCGAFLETSYTSLLNGGNRLVTLKGFGNFRDETSIVDIEFAVYTKRIPN